MRSNRRVAIIGLCAALGLTTAIAAQTAGQAQHPATHSGSKTQSSHAAQHQAGSMTDAEFVPMMIKHHQDGIEMARLEEQKGSSADVKALAMKIREGQERELADLKQHESHVASGAAAKGTSGHEGHDKMMAQQSQASMKRLQDASGDAADRAFVEEMAKHHQMAIDMVSRTKFQNAELRKMAATMAAGQRKELAELKKLQSARPK